MSSKIMHGAGSGLDLYLVFLNEEGDWWNTDTEAFENYDAGNWADYAVAMNEFGVSGKYRGTAPTFAAGRYAWFIQEQAGGSPAVSDETVGQGSLEWDGEGYADIFQVITHGDAEWKTATAEQIGGAVLTNAANKLACNASGEVTVTDASAAEIAAAAASALSASLTAIASYIDTEVGAIKLKTDNLPSDPADASVVAGLIDGLATTLANVSSALTTLATYVDTEVAAIKAKTDNLPSDPADQSVLAAAIAAVGVPPTLTEIVDGVLDEALAGHATAGSVGEALGAGIGAEAVMDATVDGAVDVRQALKEIRAMAVGPVRVIDTNPRTIQTYDAADENPVSTVEYSADDTERLPI